MDGEVVVEWRWWWVVVVGLGCRTAEHLSAIRSCRFRSAHLGVALQVRSKYEAPLFQLFIEIFELLPLAFVVCDL